MIEAAIVGMGRWGQTLVDSVQNRNDAGIRFLAGSTGRPERDAESGSYTHLTLPTNLRASIVVAACMLSRNLTDYTTHLLNTQTSDTGGKGNH